MDARRRGGVSKREAWRACAPLFADSRHFNEEQDPDQHSSEVRSGSVLSEKMDPDPHLSNVDQQPAFAVIGQDFRLEKGCLNFGVF